MEIDKLSIIIPTYNERENISALIPEIFDVFQENQIRGEVVIVDDNSPDGTADVAESMQEEYNVIVVKRRGKLGLSSAVLEGFKFSNGYILGVMDADFSHPIKMISKMFYTVLKGYDFVVGSRYVKGGGIENWSWKRKLISKVATWLARPVTNLKDPMSGFFFLNRGVIGGVRLNPLGYKIGLEIAVKGKYRKVKEVPYIFRDRRSGESKMGRKEIIDYLKHILGLYWYKLNAPKYKNI